MMTNEEREAWVRKVTEAALALEAALNDKQHHAREDFRVSVGVTSPEWLEYRSVSDPGPSYQLRKGYGVQVLINHQLQVYP